jgi:catechol 2,3-dioxygenase-like lactoylglutathione lyase family enzyme
VFDSVHHVQLAMPRGAEVAARAFFVDVLGMPEIDKPVVLAARGGVWFRIRSTARRSSSDRDRFS